jgi:hypothetical protein
MSTFARVQEILNSAIANWTQQNGRPPILPKHGAGFGWANRDQLVNSVAFGVPLIAPDTIGNDSAETANLIVALRTGVPGFPQMPIDGPFLSDAEINEIVEWIKYGALP